VKNGNCPATVKGAEDGPESGNPECLREGNPSREEEEHHEIHERIACCIASGPAKKQQKII
jgi:hypothetical protein